MPHSAERKREHAKQVRKDRLSRGLCKQCGVRPLVTSDMCRECRIKANTAQRHRWQEIRKEVLDHYGAPYCACCHESYDYEFLHLDHINGGGNEHRRSLSPTNSKTGTVSKLYRQLKRANYPFGFQALCANCNMAKGLYGECPHKRQLNSLLTKLAAMPLTY